ncbi:hypothetical protein Taro_020082 [Colocasia esculenta]|uniref:Uncharacterized protein n=1 Tax=Colocasia esculenta TaxID=4460 RepID=A0A843V476_COLES|nr:hypothetical protein [Colocasia esculenta]
MLQYETPSLPFMGSSVVATFRHLGLSWPIAACRGHVGSRGLPLWRHVPPRAAFVVNQACPRTSFTPSRMRAGHASSPLTLPSLSRQRFFRGQLGQTLLQHLGQGPSIVPRAFVSSNIGGRQDSLSNRGDSNFGGLFLARSRSNLSRPELRPISDSDSTRRDHRPISFGGLLPRCWSLLPTDLIGRCRSGHYVVRLGTAKRLSASLPGVDCTLADTFTSAITLAALSPTTQPTVITEVGGMGGGISPLPCGISPLGRTASPAPDSAATRGDRPVLGTELRALVR